MFSESARRAEGSFKYPIRRHTPSFWLALAFVIVKGISKHMPPTEIIADIPEDPIDTIGEQLHHSLRISQHSPGTTSRVSSSNSRLSSVSPSIASSSTGLETPTSEAEVCPIVYSHVRNLRGVLSSHYYPTSTKQIRTLSRSLGSLASRYLASHGYRAEDVNLIMDTYRRTHSREEFVTSLARRGMAVNEANFLLVLIDIRDEHDTNATTY